MKYILLSLFVCNFLIESLLGSDNIIKIAQQNMYFDSVEFKYLLVKIDENSHDTNQKIIGTIKFNLKEKTYNNRQVILKQTKTENIYKIQNIVTVARDKNILSILTEYPLENTEIKFNNSSNISDIKTQKTCEITYDYFNTVPLIMRAWILNLSNGDYIPYRNLLDNAILHENEIISNGFTFLLRNNSSEVLSIKQESLLTNDGKPKKSMEIFFGSYATSSNRIFPLDITINNYHDDLKSINKYSIIGSSIKYTHLTDSDMKIVLPAGTRVFDQIKNKNYVITDISIENSKEEKISNIIENTIKESKTIPILSNDKKILNVAIISSLILISLDKNYKYLELYNRLIPQKGSKVSIAD